MACRLCAGSHDDCLDTHDLVISPKSRCNFIYLKYTIAALNIKSTVQHLPLVFTLIEVLEGPIHGGNALETSNCN
jgi:hypothetical protein